MKDWKQSVFSDGSSLFITPQNPQAGAPFTVQIRMGKEAPIEKVYIRYLWNGEETVKEMTKQSEDSLFSYYSFDYQTAQPSFLYRFILVTPEGVYFYNQQGISEHNPMECYDFRLLINWRPVDWVKKGVCYQIFPDRVCNGDPSNDVVDGAFTYKGFSSK